MSRLRGADIADGWHDLRSHAHAVDGVVHGLLAICIAEGRDLGAELVAAGLIALHGNPDERLLALRAAARQTGLLTTDVGLVDLDWAAQAVPDGHHRHGWPGYRPATWKLYTHERHAVGGAKASDLLPGVHRIASLAQRWLLGTHQGAVDEAHLTSYLDEFVFRFNRRRSRSRAMLFYRVLELAATHNPVRYRDLILNPRRTTTPRRPPSTRGHPSSLERLPAERPWRRSPRPSSG